MLQKLAHELFITPGLHIANLLDFDDLEAEEIF